MDLDPRVIDAEVEAPAANRPGGDDRHHRPAVVAHLDEDVSRRVVVDVLGVEMLRGVDRELFRSATVGLAFRRHIPTQSRLRQESRPGGSECFRRWSNRKTWNVYSVPDGVPFGFEPLEPSVYLNVIYLKILWVDHITFSYGLV